MLARRVMSEGQHAAPWVSQFASPPQCTVREAVAMVNCGSVTRNLVGRLLSIVGSGPGRRRTVSPIRWRSLLLGVAVLLVGRSPASGLLQPDEIAIIAMGQSRESRRVAQYYASARKIPPSHICLIDGKPGVSLRRSAWEVKVRPAIRRWIFARQLETNSAVSSPSGTSR